MLPSPVNAAHWNSSLVIIWRRSTRTRWSPHLSSVDQTEWHIAHTNIYTVQPTTTNVSRFREPYKINKITDNDVISDLTAVSTGRCTKKYDPCALVKTPLMDSGQPVCGTDDVTYTSIESLWCIKRKEKKGRFYCKFIYWRFVLHVKNIVCNIFSDLRFKHDGQCIWDWHVN